MGVDGWVTILDAKIVREHNFDPYKDFQNVNEQDIFDKHVYTVYSDDYNDLDQQGQMHNMFDYHEINAIVGEWQLWT